MGKYNIVIKIYKGKAKNSRKGKYVYIKEKGKVGRRYKFFSNLKNKDYIKKYVESNKKVRTRKISKPKEFVSKISKRKDIQQFFKSGVNFNKINRCFKSTSSQIIKENKKLLSYSVKDNDLLNILAEEENMKKIKFRLEHRIEFIGEKGEVLATSSEFNQTTLEVIEKIRRSVYEGLNIGLNNYELEDRLKFNNLQKPKIECTGRLKDFNVKTIFRKV